MAGGPVQGGARGGWIRLLRSQLRITQAQLAELLDTCANEVGYYEAGRRDPSAPRRRILQWLRKALERHPAERVYPPGPLTVDQRLQIVIVAAVDEVKSGGAA